MEPLFLLALIIVSIPFVLPIVAYVSVRRSRARIRALETALDEQRMELDLLQARLREVELGRTRAEPSVPRVTPESPQPVARPQPGPVVESREPAPAGVPPPIEPQPTHVHPEPEATPPARAPASGPIGPEPIAVPVLETPSRGPLSEAARPEPAGAPPVSEPVQPPRDWLPPPAEPPYPPLAGFDWEGLVGVKLFSAIAGIALVIAAVFFLRYSIEAGWLQPPVRVAIGIVVSIALLVACEMKAARRYPATANALDAAAIAILFSTFFAAHALWDLIPGSVTFLFLALVTVLAVLLSIRRESLFIAVLGLLGGFSTPALLSTGENRPVPLFAYLLLLNIGLAWVASRRAWPVLAWLSLGFTTVYQWGWVLKFLGESSLPLAMGIFMVFPLAAIAGVVLREGGADDRAARAEHGIERAALLSAALPLLFVIYLAAIPGYGARAALLFGFLLLLDIGLLVIAVARRVELLHTAGAIVTLATFAIWFATSYEAAQSPRTAIAFAAAFVVLYLYAPAAGGRAGAPFAAEAASSDLTAPLLLFAFVVLAGIEPAFAAPWPLFAPLLGLVLLIAWRAIASLRGGLYFTAAFFAIGSQAIWSATHLTLERLPAAVSLYAAFGFVALAVPAAARRLTRTLEPAWGHGAVLLASLPLLLFLSLGDVAPAALWALALLLAILNASLFIESAAAGLPVLAQMGTVASWLVLVAWWGRAAGTVGVIPSLTVLTGLTLVTLAGYAWSALRPEASASSAQPGFIQGAFLGLTGHLFLVLVALNREWSIPPWPLFGSLVVITLGVTATSLAVRSVTLHNGGTAAAAAVIAAFGWAAGAPPYGLVSIVAAAVISGYAIVWLRLPGAFSFEALETGSRDPALRVAGDPAPRVGRGHGAAVGAAVALAAAELTAILTVAGGARPPFVAVVLLHTCAVSALLAVIWVRRWRWMAVAAVLPGWIAVAQWQDRADLASVWPQLLGLAGALYAVFAAYPLLLGTRAREDRDPYLAAIAASAMFFFAGRAALEAGGLDWMSGIVPVGASAVLALHLRELLRLEPAGDRDAGRLALVAGAALAFVTVAIPVQLDHQWVTIGWALEGAALAWLYGRVSHRGLLAWSVALLGIVFVRLALNPSVLSYEPRGAMRIFNWYLYTYLLCAGALILAGWWLSKTDDRPITGFPRASQVLPTGGVILLFVLLNIEIADFYATGPAIVFDFGVTLSQDLTYTIGWLAFGMLLLAAGIFIRSRPARVAAVALIAVTTFKCFLYDLRSLEGLYRVASFVGLALSLALVSLALQKYVLSKPRGAA